MASVFDDKKKPSMVADILSGGGAFLKGAASNFTGIADLVAMSPVVAAKMMRGMNLPEAVSSSSGIVTNAAGLAAPPENTMENLAYSLGQIATPVGMPASRGRYLSEVATNTGLSAANNYLPEGSGMTIPIAAGLFGGASAVNAIRNKQIANMGYTPEAAAAAKSKGLTLGQQTGNPEALRNEVALSVAPGKADKIKDFYTKQAGDFESLVRNVTSKIDVTQPSNLKAARSAFEQIAATYKGRQQALSTKYGEDLQKFYDKTNNGKKPFIPSDRMVAEIDDIIAEQKTSVGSSGNEKIIKELEKIRNQLIDPDTMQPRAITGREFKSQQSYWSQASNSPDSWLDGIARDTSKALAAKMANAMDETFDAATVTFKNTKQVKALKEFQAAREQYRLAKTQMDDYAADPVNRFFDTDNVFSLKGDEIVEKIAAMPPETRRESIKYLEKIAPELVGNVRTQLVDSMVNKGIITGAAEQGAKFDSNAFLKAFDDAALKDPHILDLMFPNPADQTKFKQQLQQARKMKNSQEAVSLSGANPAVAAASDIASLQGGQRARVATRGAFGAMKDTLNSTLLPENQLFNMLFKNEDIRGRFLNSYNRGIMKTAGQESTRDANLNAEPDTTAVQPSPEEEMAQAYEEFEKMEQAPTEAPVPLSEEEELAKAYEEFEKMEQQKPTDMAPMPIQGQQP